jgi:hypothetical protein
MPALPKNVVGAVDKRKVKVFYANRSATKFWNESRNSGDLRFFGGWYWYTETNGKATETEHGPYRSESAAYRNAFLELSLSRLQDSELTTQIRGTGVVRAPGAATPVRVPRPKKKAEGTAVPRRTKAALAKKQDAEGKPARARGRKVPNFRQALESARKRLNPK